MITIGMLADRPIFSIQYRRTSAGSPITGTPRLHRLHTNRNRLFCFRMSHDPFMTSCIQEFRIQIGDGFAAMPIEKLARAPPPCSMENWRWSRCQFKLPRVYLPLKSASILNMQFLMCESTPAEFIWSDAQSSSSSLQGSWQQVARCVVNLQGL